jgi:hypothetical protein
MRELELRGQEIQLASDLNALGLRGTLAGALAGVALAAALAATGAFSERIAITGWHICFIVAVISVAVVFFGAFVFNRSAKIVADVQRGTFAAQVLPETPPASERD